MSRNPCILQSQFPYHIGARSINKDWFNIPMQEVWSIMSEQLFFVHHAFHFKIFAFVLMNNHFHLIVQTPEANLSDGMRWFMRETSRELARKGNRINQTYGGRYFRSIIKTPHHYLNTYKYVYHNPIKAGICKNVLDYPFSTIQGVLGKDLLLIPLEEDETLFNSIEDTLSWLNQIPTDQNWESVRKALRRSEFKLTNVNKKKHPLENDAM